MSRMYIVNHWSDAAAYSGEQIGDRMKDSTALHFNRDGSANVNLYSEETAASKNKPSVSIQDRILPQQRRVNTLTEQMKELCAEYKAGNMDIQEYSQLLAIVTAKRDRAIELLKKAKNTKPKRLDDEDTHAEAEEENVVFKGENPIKQSQKKLESCVFLGACVLVSIVMLILSH